MNDITKPATLSGEASELTDVLGALADQFECHAASRGIDQVEEAGRAMRAAKHEIESLRGAMKKLRKVKSLYSMYPARGTTSYGKMIDEALAPNV